MDINLLCPVNSLGYGIVGLSVALAFERADKSPALWPVGQIEAPSRHHDTLRAMIARQASYSPDAPSLRIWHPFDLAQHVGHGYHCAYTFFELDRLKPVEIHHLKCQDVVFAPSHWARRVLQENGIPEWIISCARPGVDREIFDPDRYGGASCIPQVRKSTTVFLNVGKWEVRKGHPELVEAFAKAFGPDDDVLLVMNCHNPCFRTREEMDRYNAQFVRLYKEKLGEKVLVIENRLPSQEDVAALIGRSDCCVFPSRGEGWNMESLECLSMGKELIITNYSAHTEFATEENARLIHVDGTEPAFDGHWFDDEDPVWNGNPGHWASLGESQVDQLVEHLRAVHKAKQSGELKPNLKGIETAKRFSWDSTIREMLEAIR